MKKASQVKHLQKQKRDPNQNQNHLRPLNEDELNQVAGGKMGPSNYE